MNQDVRYPLPVLHPKRLTDSVAVPKSFKLRRIDALALCLERGNLRGEEVAWWQLDDEERDHRDDDQGRDCVQDPLKNESEHGASFGLFGISRRGRMRSVPGG